MIRHLIWDVDGTLFDTYPAIVQAFLSALKSFGQVGVPEDITPLAKESLSQCSRVLASQRALPAAAFHDRFLEEYRRLPKAIQVPFAGSTNVCEAVAHAGGINAIVTHRARSSAEALLVEHDLRSLFVEIIGGDDGFPRKPDPAAFVEILNRHSLSPDQTAAVGDRSVDMEAGKAAGVRTCLFTVDDSAAGADFRFAHYEELLAYVGAA
jgi:phosphoglycolate phosphatase-like HAD superfamily hydrolase